MLDKLKRHGIENIQKFNLTFIMENRRFGNPAIALLKVAYLMTFYTLGYTAILYKNMLKIREQIQNPDKEVLDNFVYYNSDLPNELLGVSLVKYPKENRGIYVIFDVLINGISRRVLVILPNLEEPGFNIYTKALEQGKEIKFTKVDFHKNRLINPDSVFEILDFWKD